MTRSLGNRACCPACGQALEAWRSAPAAEPCAGTRRRFALDRCRACGLARLAARGEVGDSSRLYETGTYRPGKPRLEWLAAPLLWLFDRQRLRLLGEAVPAGSRVLDIGAGRGRFLAHLRAAGYQARGIEPSERGYHACLERGVPVERAGIEQAHIEPGSLDAAVLWHVLEHLSDPPAALERIHAWLRPGGALLVGVPNLVSLQARLGGDRWFHLDLPRHLTHFTPQALDSMLTSRSFRTGRPHHLLLEHNQLGMWQTLLNRLTATPNFLYNVLKRNVSVRDPRHLRDAAVTVVAGFALLPVAALAELAAGLACRGGTIAVVAHRV